jgi:hypothetical protein
MNNKIQYVIKMHDKLHTETFEENFYINSNINYIEVLKQLIKVLERYNLDISTDNLFTLVVGGNNPKEEVILVERVT